MTRPISKCPKCGMKFYIDKIISCPKCFVKLVSTDKKHD